VARAAFSFTLGFFAGVAGVLAFQSFQKKGVVETAECLVDELGDKMKALESRIANVTAPVRKRARKTTTA
jgi:hypothetical protein